MVKGIDAYKIKEWQDKGKDFYLIDARDKDDYKKDHLPGALSLLLSEITEKSIEVFSKNIPVVVYSNDENCPASGLVSEKLASLGFSEVYDYNPSYADWKEKGYPLEG